MRWRRCPNETAATRSSTTPLLECAREVPFLPNPTARRVPGPGQRAAVQCVPECGRLERAGNVFPAAAVHLLGMPSGAGGRSAEARCAVLQRLRVLLLVLAHLAGTHRKL